MQKLGKLKTLAFASLAAVAVATPVAIAQTAGQGDQQKPRAERGGKGDRRGHGGFGRRGGMGFRGIELTEEQKTRLGQIHQSFDERTKPLREQLRAKRRELRQAEQGTTFNEALAAQKLAESAAVEAKLMGERFRLRQESLSVLTAEQRQQLEQRKQQRESRRGGRRGGQPRASGVSL
jgi:periplasmic protein CpxP/Spy